MFKTKNTFFFVGATSSFLKLSRRKPFNYKQVIQQQIQFENVVEGNQHREGFAGRNHSAQSLLEGQIKLFAEGLFLCSLLVSLIRNYKREKHALLYEGLNRSVLIYHHQKKFTEDFYRYFFRFHYLEPHKEQYNAVRLEFKEIHSKTHFQEVLEDVKIHSQLRIESKTRYQDVMAQVVYPVDFWRPHHKKQFQNTQQDTVIHCQLRIESKAHYQEVVSELQVSQRFPWCSSL